MQAVILAAGRGSRMGALTDTTPKPMLHLAGKTLMEHKLDALPKGVDEVIVIVGYLGSVIHDYFGGAYKGVRMLYVEQDVLDGTGGALWRARDILKDRFFVMMGDDLYSRADMEACLAHPDGWTMLVQDSDNVRGGIVKLNRQKRITSIVESSGGSKGHMGTNLFVLDTRVFDYPLVPKAKGSEEYGLPQTIVAASKASGIPFYGVPATGWIQITSPEDISQAEELLA